MSKTRFLLIVSAAFLFANSVFALDNPITVESTKSAKINFYCYEGAEGNAKEKPILLVHGFNSSGEAWANKNNNYVRGLNERGYDVIVVDMRGNAVDTNGDRIVDAPCVGDSWGYSARDLGDDVGVALKEGIDYLNKNLPNRDYKKADVITHSTGALAVTAYSRSIGLVPYRDNIDTIIELAPPNNGSTSLVANIKNILGVIPSVFSQSVTAFQYALEVSDNKIWIPGSRMESENLRKELCPDSLFLKSIQDLGPDKRIKTFIGIGNEDWVVGDWSPVIGKRDDIGYEYFLGMDHFNFCSSQTALTAIADKLEKGASSKFFNRFKPYKNKQLAFLSGPGIDHPDDTFDTVDFAKGVDISPSGLFDLYLRIACRKNKVYLLKYWEVLTLFKAVQSEISNGLSVEGAISKWGEALTEQNKLLNSYYMHASREYLETPDIAVLANGYYNEMRKLIIEKIGEPVRIVDHTFEPYIIDEQKIIVIPSGGLSGLSHSAIFKNKLSEYVKNGGTVVCFSQQYGYDFNALPGGDLSAYGWQEDISCHAKAAYIENFHQILSSQTELYPDVKLDGYFTDYPDGAIILLRRSKNQMPAMLMYSFGKGIVIASTLYSDWGYLNGQASSSEISLARDIILWAKSAKLLPEHKTGETLEIQLHPNIDFNSTEMILKSLDGGILEKKISNEAIYKLGYALTKPGIYSVDYILYNSGSSIIQPQTEGAYFSFSKPPALLNQHPDFTFDITSESENYVSGSEATFTFHLWNNTSKSEQIRCKAYLPHHKIEFNELVTVPPNSAISFNKNILALSTDLLSACFYSSENVYIGKAERGINVFQPEIDINITPDKDQYLPLSPVSLAISLKNKTSAAVNITTILDVTDSNNNEIYYNSSEMRLAEMGSVDWPGGFTMPEDVSRGLCRAKLNVFSYSKLLGSKTTYLEIPAPPASNENIIDSYTAAGLNTDLTFNLGNVYPKDLPVSTSIKIVNNGAVIEEGSVDISVFPDAVSWPLCGMVKDVNGIPVKGAKIGSFFTNQDARYLIKNLSVGKYGINARAAGFDAILKDINIFPGINIADIVLTPSKYGNLSGIIENSIGSNIALEPVTRFSVTGGDSQFKFKYLPIGSYLLTVSPGGISRDIQIMEGENTLNTAIDPGVYQDFQETEPNSAFATASNAGLGSRLHGRIYPAGDEDFFAFNVAEKGILYIKMYEVPQGLRPSVKIYDAAIPGRIVSQKGGSANEQIILETEFDKPGLYYLLVRDWYGNIGPASDYSINFNFIKTMDEYEPNDTKEASALIELNKDYFATIAVKADSDFYKLSIPDAGKVSVYLKDMPSNIRPYMKLYRDTGQVIDIKGGAAGEDVAMEFETIAPSNYYVQVYDRYNSESSFLRYRFLAVYTPKDQYLATDPSIFKKHEDITGLQGESRIDFEIPAIAIKGKYYIEAMVRSSMSGEISRLVRSFYIGDKPAPALFKAECLEQANLSFDAGAAAEFRFNIINQGGTRGACDISFKCLDLINKTQSISLEPGWGKEVAFDFFIPADMEEGSYEAEYSLDGKTQKVNFSIKSMKVEVKTEVEGNVLKLNIKNLSSAKGVKLFAEARREAYENRINFILDTEKILEFNIPDLNNGEKVYYGIYFESGKSLYLNSYLGDGEDKPKASPVKIIRAWCDKDIYKNGDRIVINWKVESNEACSVGISADLITPDLDSANVIKENLVLSKGVNEIHREISTALDKQGIYRVMYEFIDIGQGSVFFDVGEKEAPEVNHEPVLLTIGSKEVFFGNSLEFFIDAIDIDGDLLTYSVVAAPCAAYFDPLTKRFFWKPEEKDIGEHFVNFIVSDGKVKSQERVKITVARPIAEIPEIKGVVEPMSGLAPLEAHFSFQTLNNCRKIVKYEWDFDGKGVYDFSSQESGNTIFVYTGEGDFPAVLRVTDTSGVTSTDTVTIKVEKNPDAPGVYLSAHPLKGIAPCKVFFEGGAFCPQGAVKYEWDFEGDGVFDSFSANSGEIVKLYTVPGKYTAQLRVTSIDGLTGVGDVSIEIEDPKTLSVKPLISPVKGNVPVEVSFEIEPNVNKKIKKYQWDFEGDGVFDCVLSGSKIVKHTYCEPGMYSPVCRITDSNNLSSQARSEIRFGIADPENITKGRIVADFRSGKAPFLAKFSFNGGDDISGAKYLWDFDGDGAVDLSTPAKHADFTYNDAGVYIANLDVKVNSGVILSCQESIYVMSGKGNEKANCDESNNVNKDKIGRIELEDKTSLVLPADMLDKDDVVNIKKLAINQIKKEIDINNAKSVGEYREYKFEGSTNCFDKEMTISIPYKDENEDGIVDDKNIDELTLGLYWYDEEASEWNILTDSAVLPTENLVTAKTNHFTIFGIAGTERYAGGSQDPAPSGDSNESSGSGSSSGGSSGCFIATAAFGTPMASEVKILSDFRDKTLLKTKFGRKFVNFYYSFSPPVAEFIRNKPILKFFIRFHLKFLVNLVKSIL